MTKKRYYKNGDPELYNHFSEDEVKNWTEREKALWHPYSDVEQAPIPEEVINFQEKQINEQRDTLSQKDKEIADLKKKLDEAKKTDVIDVHDDLGEPQKEEPPTEEQQKKMVMEELRAKGIRFAPNSKLETLQKKLQDADN